MTSIFQKGDLLKDIGYWNLMYDQLGGEGYNYSADGNGYTSNVINWNAAVALEANNEFTPGNQYKTITTGYSGMFNALFDAIVSLAKEKGVKFKYFPHTRLHSIVVKQNVIHYAWSTREKPCEHAGSSTTNAAWLAMPRHAIELVAQGSRFLTHGDDVDVLNHRKVKLYLEAAIMQPSYKVGMFFDSPWWLSPEARYPAQLTSYVVTESVRSELEARNSPTNISRCSRRSNDVPYASTSDFIQDVRAADRGAANDQAARATAGRRHPQHHRPECDRYADPHGGVFRQQRGRIRAANPSLGCWPATTTKRSPASGGTGARSRKGTDRPHRG